jgi:ATP-binding cassette subfamily F protein 3
MLSLQNAGKRFGAKILFTDANWLITAQEKTALVGANGTGKSTLMKVLAGDESVGPLDYGSLQRTRGMSIGYLPQEGLRLSGRSVFDECLSVFDQLRSIEAEIESLAASLASLDHQGSEYSAAAERYSMLQGRFQALDGYALDSQVGTVLTGLGFGKEDWSRRTEEFSGGWQMRIALAKLLLAKPNLLLLDEPTNHLDLETRNWLETYLKSYPFGYILISHDRYFLDVTVTRTVEIWNKRLQIYSGNYTKFLNAKEERKAQLLAAYKNQREQIEHLEAFINRFRAQATKAKQVQSRIKELERIERIEIPEEEPVIHFSFPQPPPSGRTVVTVHHLKKSYGEKHVLTGSGSNGINFTIERGDRVALVGHNGAGKSTLIRLLMGMEAPTSGSVQLGHNVIPEYFAQDQYKVLDPSARMLEDISRAAIRVPEVELRSLLGCFLFSGDDVFKPLGVLSGGERNRFALARILVSPSNFLLLDEPTNHLDMRAKDVLLEAIESFTGTVIFVSHDRYFLDRLATKVLEVKDGEVLVYPGSYAEFVRDRELAANGASQPQTPGAPPVSIAAAQPEATSPNGRPAAAASAPAGAAPEPPSKDRVKRLNPIKLKQMEDRCAFLEEEVPRIEASIALTETQLGDYVSAGETARLSLLLEELRSQLAQSTAEWEELMMALEEQSQLT